jgi:acetoacetyl-CoA synthetase
MPLFVVLRPGCALDRLLIERIRGEIRNHLSPRHIPSEIFQVAEIP